MHLACVMPLLFLAAAGPAIAATTAPLDLEAVLALAVARAPEVRASRMVVEAARGRLLTARSTPAPELGLEAEEFGLDRPGFSEVEYTLSMTRPLEPARRRRLRAAASTQRLEQARAEAHLRLLEHLDAVARAFYDLTAAGARVGVARDEERLARNLRDVARLRVKAGASAGLEQERAEIELSTAAIDLERTLSERDAAGAVLRAMLQLPADEPLAVTDATDQETTLPDVATAWTRVLEHHPSLAAAARALDAGAAATAVARAEARPLVGATVGLRYLAGSEEATFVAGATLPLGTGRRARGAVLEAEAEQRRAEAERDATQLQLRQDLLRCLSAARRTAAELRALREDVLPRAQSVFRAISEGYRRGEYGWPDLLEARRTLVEAGRKSLTARVDHRQALLDLDRALGGSPLVAKLVKEALS